jgi:hypothetical protein
MFIKKFALLASLCALGIFGVAAGSASAASYLHDSVTGTVLSAGTTIAPGSSGNATLTVTGLGTVTCTNNTFSGTVGASGGATITGSIDSLTFNSCTDTIPVITISNCNVVSPLPSVVATASGSTGGSLNLSNTYVRCNVSGSTAGCYYLATTANGTVNNTGSTLAYSNVAVSHSVPTGGSGDLGALCGSGATFSVQYNDVQTPSNGHDVILNTTP